jgi:uncharacterized circularly permuted ATP-grasp superfamily protein/uncharacterized alpha-E superfamily protein
LPHAGLQPEPEDTASHAARLAAPARAGHYDELRDEPRDGALDGATSSLRATWRAFFSTIGDVGLADLDRRASTVARQIADDGVTYNVYNEEGGPQRPWPLEVLPFLISAEEWSAIEAGIAQRALLLQAILADVYGAGELLRAGLLPPALVYGHPGYLRPLAGATPAGSFLHIVAFDLARAADGRWWVVSQRTQAPSGLGYALQNRLIVTRLFPDAFREMHVQRLASSYRRLLDTLLRQGAAIGATGAPRVVLLTPGPYNETYFEHAYLARYLGVPLVEGGDLTVRDDQVFLKSLYGLERVHAILRRLDDDYCDPLELRPDSSLGVPGLLQAVRAGNVVMANALGSGFLESPAINGFLPAIARYLLGSELVLPSQDSWWCGEAAARDAAVENLEHMVVKPTYGSGGGRGFESRIAANQSEAERKQMLERIEHDPDAVTLQSYVPLSQTPTWTGGSLVPRAAMVRTYAIVDASGGWHALPGGLTRIAARYRQGVSMQRGGSSADTWVQAAGLVDTFSMLPEPLRPEDLVHKRRSVSSRAAENLFWMGRYSERSELSVRLARSVLMLLADDADMTPSLLGVLHGLCVRHGLVPDGVPTPAQSLPVFERTLIDGLVGGDETFGLAFNLDALVRAGAQIRDRLAAEHWRLLVGAAETLKNGGRRNAAGAWSSDQVMRVLTDLALRLAAITGAQTDRMTRDDGWRLLTVGRQVERLADLSHAMHMLFDSAAILDDDGFDLLLGVFDSRITYRALYQRRQEMPPVLDLLVQDGANPRSFACIVGVLRAELARLPASDADALVRLLPGAEQWPLLATLCELDDDGRYARLLEFTTQLQDGAAELSNAVEKLFFSHTAETFRQVMS